MEKQGTSDDTGRVKKRHAVGCILILVGLPLLLLVGVFYFGSLHQKEWEAARPANLSKEEWASKQSLCETALMSAEKCATTTKVEVVKLGREVTERQTRELCAKDARYDAIAQAKDAVLANLKSPSSADFGAERIVAVQDGCNWTVTGQVDAQNAFGAKLRSPFKVKLHRVSDSVWVPTSVRVD